MVKASGWEDTFFRALIRGGVGGGVVPSTREWVSWNGSIAIAKEMVRDMVVCVVWRKRIIFKI